MGWFRVFGAALPSERALNPRKRWRRQLVAVLAGLLALVVALALVEGWQAFGRAADGERRARIERSPQWRDGQFVNPEPITNHLWRMLGGLLEISPEASPGVRLPVENIEPARFATAPASGLRVTWLGHSSMLIEIDGHRVLTDPMWSDRSSPIGWIGPTRWFPPPIALERLPAIDAVVVSHDHYDHLDYRTISAMKDWDTRFVVPLGVGAHLAYWGVPPAKIVELDWWEQAKVRELTIVCTPARHASGRTLFDRDATLWAGYALVGLTHRAYYSGDTGLFPAMREIGARLGPFDVTLIETGQYHPGWPDWHIGPEQAVLAHTWLRGGVLLPVHWGLLQLAYHGWTEPIERVLVAARKAGVSVLTPKPGQSVEPEAPSHLERWWPSVPWQTAAEMPIVSSKVPVNAALP